MRIQIFKPKNVVAFFATAAVGVTAVAMFATPQNVPVERIVSNLTAFTNEHPEDASGFYTLGRAHSLAFTRAVDIIPVYTTHGEGIPLYQVQDGSVPSSGPREGEPKGNPVALTPEQLASHLENGILSFEKARALKPGDALHAMSLAFLLERGAPFAGITDFIPGLPPPTAPTDAREAAAVRQLLDELEKATDPMSLELEVRETPIEVIAGLWPSRSTLGSRGKPLLVSVVAEHWIRLAITTYLEAFRSGLPEDLKGKKVTFSGARELVSFQAGEAFLRLSRDCRGTKDAAAIKEVEDGLQKVKSLQFGRWVTPVICSLEFGKTLEDLVDVNTRVRFDLDGTGRGLEWEWVQPTTAILVWESGSTGKIHSGLQLFGNATWWLFFADGYRALDALDDNRDRELSGSELNGIAVWFDRNQNGVSDPFEVVSLESCGIRGISVRSSEIIAGCPANLTGLRMADGRFLPTYDWIAHGHITNPKDLARAASMPR